MSVFQNYWVFKKDVFIHCNRLFQSYSLIMLFLSKIFDGKKIHDLYLYFHTASPKMILQDLICFMFQKPHTHFLQKLWARKISMGTRQPKSHSDTHLFLLSASEFRFVKQSRVSHLLKVARQILFRLLQRERLWCKCSPTLICMEKRGCFKERMGEQGGGMHRGWSSQGSGHF